MKCHHMKRSEKHSIAPRAFPVMALGTMLALVPGALAQRSAVSHSAGFGGGHVGGFSGGGVHGSFSAPRSFGGPVGLAPRGFGVAPRMTFTAPRYSFVPRQGAYMGYRPLYGNGNGGGRDHRRPYRSPYTGYVYGGLPYAYGNSWELLPWDLGYPDFTGYGDDNGAAEPNHAQEPPWGGEQPPQEYEGYGPEYSPSPYPPPATQAVAPAPLRNQPELTLIFKDGHTQVVRNYLLTPSQLIVMDEAASGREPRIPLSELNLPATERAAQQAGLDFSPPST